MSVAYLITGGLGDFGGGTYPTAAEIAAAVRTNLTIELARIDISISDIPTALENADAITSHSKTLTVPKFIGLK